MFSGSSIRQTRLPTIFQTTMSLDAPRIPFRSRGVLPGLLGHFSSLQMERIERLFATVDRPVGNGNQPLMGCDSGEGGGSLALHGVSFLPLVPFIPTASSMGLCFVSSPALTGAVRTGLSGRDRQED